MQEGAPRLRPVSGGRECGPGQARAEQEEGAAFSGAENAIQSAGEVQTSPAVWAWYEPGSEPLLAEDHVIEGRGGFWGSDQIVLSAGGGHRAE